MDAREPHVILVVDDDGIGRSVVAGVLRDAGMRTLEADSGAAALEVLADWRVDAVLVDQSMPGMSGLELTRLIRVRAEHALTPILFLSAVDSHETRLAALRAGATDFMVKPIPYDEIVARLEAQMELSGRWAATVHALEQRAGTLVALAGLGCEPELQVLAGMVCERLSTAHGGNRVAIYACVDSTDQPTPLAAAGGPASGAASGGDLLDPAGRVLALRGDPVPWIEYPTTWSGGSNAPSWVVCCPLRQRHTTFGILAIEGGDQPQEELLAAAVDYASTVALLLGPAMATSRHLWESRAAVERVLDTVGYEPLFQPIVDISSGEALGYEALTRLKDGSPVVELLAEADEAGLRHRAEMELLAAALRQAGSGLGSNWLSINLSPSVLVERTQEVASLISACDCQVVIELTENERIEDYPAVGAAFERLGRRVRLSVDDTGSGYASLRHVIALHPHFLKLDRSWITGLDTDETRQALVAGMVAFCRHTNTEMIAEGVETRSELDTLRRLGVRLAQGYLLGRPAPLQEAGEPQPADR